MIEALLTFTLRDWADLALFVCAGGVLVVDVFAWSA
jgi:hypothetical protein